LVFSQTAALVSASACNIEQQSGVRRKERLNKQFLKRICGGFSVKSLDEIRRIKRDVEAELLELPGVIGVDVGRKYVNGKKTDEIAIRVYVEKKKEVPAKLAIPKEIRGVPTDVIERKIVLHSTQKSQEMRME
jgi:N-glycosylase/DNA lyase